LELHFIELFVDEFEEVKYINRIAICNEWNSMETSELDNDVTFVHMICDSFCSKPTIEFNRKKTNADFNFNNNEGRL